MKTRYIAISALALLFAACQQGGEEQLLPSNGEMQFNIATTRVANGTFEAEDKVGLYVTDYADATTPAPLQISGNRANNEVMTYDGAKWATERPIYWGEGKSDVYAYYPYMEITDVDEQPFSVATDQDVEGEYEASDLLWAKAEGIAQTDGAVQLEMQHSMSRLVVRIMAGENYKGSLPKDATVHLHSTVTDALFLLSNGAIKKNPYAGTKSIKMRNLGLHTFADGEAVVYEAIVVPQMLLGVVPLLEINSKSVSYLLEDSFNFKPGTSYTYTAVLNASTTSIKIDIGCDIDDWNNIGGGSEGEGGGSQGGEDDGIDLSKYIDLSVEGTANCYLVKAGGNYKFKAAIGNTDCSVGNVKKTEVLWETFGTDVMPNVGDLIAVTGYQNGYIYFSTAENFNNGNASIAARNSKDVILWSWHIWCSEEGWTDQVYANNAGTMMDRNLGATSATPGDIGAFGLLYQWGRKDPFMGGLLKKNTLAASTGTWSTISNSYNIELLIESPMIYVKQFGFKATESLYGKLWEDEYKTIFDPCPNGYRVPKGGENSIWVKAKNDGRIQFADGTTANYPDTGYRHAIVDTYYSGTGYYWSTTPVGLYFYCLETSGNNPLNTARTQEDGCSVRCVKE